jgi:adenylate kinase
MKLILLGAPGAGKGTQAEILSRKLGIPTISTGNILRAAMKNGTPVGKKAKEYVESGRLVPDDVIIGIVEERLAEPDCKNGYILDGMPRTIPQAEALEERGIGIDWAVSIEISDATIIARMAGRRTCKNCGATYHVVNIPPKAEGICDICGGELTIRQDDEPETVKARLEVYHRETEPLKAFYTERGILKAVENQPSWKKPQKPLRRLWALNMIIVKSPREIELMRQAGKITAAARTLARQMVAPGISTLEIDREIHRFILKSGAVPSFLGYGGFPASACISVNDEVIHGIPGPRVIREGDIVSLDVGATIFGFTGDCAGTFPCGKVSEEARLIEVTVRVF